MLHFSLNHYKFWRDIEIYCLLYKPQIFQLTLSSEIYLLTPSMNNLIVNPAIKFIRCVSVFKDKNAHWEICFNLFHWSNISLWCFLRWLLSYIQQIFCNFTFCSHSQDLSLQIRYCGSEYAFFLLHLMYLFLRQFKNDMLFYSYLANIFSFVVVFSVFSVKLFIISRDASPFLIVIARSYSSFMHTFFFFLLSIIIFIYLAQRKK